jgi:hypothetical protein
MANFKKAVVVNMNAGAKFDVYMGRPGHGFPGPFGNPFGAKMHTVRSTARGEVRDEVIRAHAEWFRKRVSSDLVFMGQVLALRGKRLGCFCKPKSCHADVIAEFVNRVEEEASFNPAMPGPMRMPFACSVCCALLYTQIPHQHHKCEGCGRWYCRTHVPAEVHACPARTP